LTLTYGAFVHKLIKDTDNAEEVNALLDKMGYNIGCRLIDEFFAKAPN
jgi:trafficking protein particle complex subunit 3